MVDNSMSQVEETTKELIMVVYYRRIYQLAFKVKVDEATRYLFLVIVDNVK